jgi:hypothetical protein
MCRSGKRRRQIQDWLGLLSNVLTQKSGQANSLFKTAHFKRIPCQQKEFAKREDASNFVRKDSVNRPEIAAS